MVTIRSSALAAAGLLALLTLPLPSPGQGPGVEELRKQLSAAVDATHHDSSAWWAVAELSRRILLLDPKDAAIWEKMARAQFEVGDNDRCEQTLVSWEESLSAHAPVIDALRGDIAFARNDHPKALDFWGAYLSSEPGAEATGVTLQKIAWSKESDGDLEGAIKLLTQRIGLGPTPGALVWRARCYLLRRNWEAASADVDAANTLAPSSDEVKEWLPRVELVQKYLPDIQGLAISPGAEGANALLDRALLFDEADQHSLALEDDEAALRDAPDSRRALLQKCKELLDLRRRDDAAKLLLNIVALEKKRHSRAKEFRAIGDLDAQLEKKPKDPNPLLVQRAVLCNEIDQFTLALQDTATVEKSGAKDASYAKALTEDGYALAKLDLREKGLKKLAEATLVDPKNSLAWRFRGEAEMLRANYPAAIDFLSRSLALEEAVPVLAERARCYRASDHTTEAEWDVERIRHLQQK